jgi:hypothetical protein
MVRFEFEPFLYAPKITANSNIPIQSYNINDCISIKHNGLIIFEKWLYNYTGKPLQSYLQQQYFRFLKYTFHYVYLGKATPQSNNQNMCPLKGFVLQRLYCNI